MQRLGTILLLALVAVSPATLAGQEIESTPAINSESYKWAIGFRAGGTDGLTVKAKTSRSTAIEGILGWWNHGFSVTGLFEKHVNAGVPGLYWYYGGGGHAAFETRDTFYRGRYDRWNDYGRDEMAIGVDGIIGLEYKIVPIPFAISLDLKPFVEVGNGGTVFGALDPGLGIKFTL